MTAAPSSSQISDSYIRATLPELQVQYGISNLATLTPALAQIFRSAQNVRVVLLASDMLHFQMKHAFMQQEGKAPFPVGAAAYYLQGRALAQGARIDPDAIREEARSLDPKKFMTDPEEVNEWMNDILAAEAIVKSIKLDVEGILENSVINLVRFAGRYGDAVAVKMAQFTDDHKLSSPMKRRSAAFALVEKIAGEDEEIAALSVRTRITIAMSISHLCEVHKDDILGLGRQYISSEAFIESFRQQEIGKYKAGLQDKRIAPSRLFPEMASLTWQQAVFLFEDIVKDAAEAVRDAEYGYDMACRRLRATLSTRAAFGQSPDTRAAIAREFFEHFSRARFAHIMENFGYRVKFAAR